MFENPEVLKIVGVAGSGVLVLAILHAITALIKVLTARKVGQVEGVAQQSALCSAQHLQLAEAIKLFSENMTVSTNIQTRQTVLLETLEKAMSSLAGKTDGLRDLLLPIPNTQKQIVDTMHEISVSMTAIANSSENKRRR